MPVANISVVSMKPHSGRYRARFLFVLDDGRKFHRALFVSTSEDADTKLIEFEADVLSSVQDLDAKEAVGLGIQSAHKEATQAQVQYAWVKEGFDSDEPYQAYEKMKDIGPTLLAMGLTDEQYSIALNCSIEEVIAAKAKWAELEANAAVISAYVGIV